MNCELCGERLPPKRRVAVRKLKLRPLCIACSEAETRLAEVEEDSDPEAEREKADLMNSVWR